MPFSRCQVECLCHKTAGKDLSQTVSTHLLDGAAIWTESHLALLPWMG